jgi:hypothetical protein
MLKIEPTKLTLPVVRGSSVVIASREAALTIAAGSALAFVAIYALRSGSGDSWTGVAVLLAFGVLPLLVGAAIASMKFASIERRNSGVAIGFILALLAPAIAIYSPALAIFVATAFGILSLAALLRSEQTPGFSGVRSIFVKAFVVAALLIVSSDPARLFLPEEMPLAMAISDSLFHIAIAQMIAHYGHVTTGADGFSYLQYYFVSHAIAAGLSKLSHVGVPLVYVYWAAILLKAQLLWAMVTSSALLEEESEARGWDTMLRLVLAWLFAVLTHVLESESFVLAMAMFLVLMPVLCGLAQIRSIGPAKTALAVGLTGALVCAATKASVGFFAAVALLGAAWRLRQFRWTSIVVVAALCLLAVVTLLYLSPANALPLANWHLLLASYAQYFDYVAIVSFAAPALLFLFAVRRPRFSLSRSTATIEWPPQETEAAGGPRRLRRATDWLFNNSSGSTFVLGLSLIACAVVLFTVPVGSNIAYFSLVLLVMTPVMAASILRPLCDFAVAPENLRRALFGFATLAAGVMAAQFAWGTKNAVTALYRSTFNTPADHGAGKLLAASLRTHRSILGGLRERPESAPWPLLTADILSKVDDGGLAVHASPSADEFWTRLSSGTPWWCVTPHLMIPAELGIVQIRDIAPQKIEAQCVPEGITFYGFGKTQELHRTALLSDEDLCAAARQIEVKRVYVINSVSDLSRNTVLTCPSAPT